MASNRNDLSQRLEPNNNNNRYNKKETIQYLDSKSNSGSSSNKHKHKNVLCKIDSKNHDLDYLWKSNFFKANKQRIPMSIIKYPSSMNYEIKDQIEIDNINNKQKSNKCPKYFIFIKKNFLKFHFNFIMKLKIIKRGFIQNAKSHIILCLLFSPHIFNTILYKSE
jgi:hypothetical protein